MKKYFLIFTILFLANKSFAFANSAPQLLDGGAQPGFVSPGETATYKVIYKDKEGDAPSYVRVNFPSGAKEMEKISGDYQKGDTYQFSWTPEKSEEYFFEASDGKETARFPNYEGGTLAPVDVLTEKLDKNKIYLFSKDSVKPLWSFETGNDWVQNVAISENGDYITAKTNSYIYFFTKDSNQPLWKYQCDGEESFSGWVDISSDGNYIAGGCQSSLSLFNKESNKPIWNYNGNSNIYAVSISGDGKYIAAGTSGTNKVLLFDKDSNKPVWEFVGEGDIHGLAIAQNGKYIAAGAHCPDRRAFAFLQESNKPLFSYQLSEDSPVWTAAISFDGKSIVYGLDGGGDFDNIFVFTPEKDEPLKSFRAQGWVRSVAMSADGKYIAAGSGTGHIVYLFDKNKDTPLWQYKADERVGAVDIASNGKYIAAGSKDKNVYVFSSESSKPLWKFSADEWVNSVAISANGDFAAAGTGASQYLSEGHTFGDLGPGVVEAECGNTICEDQAGETDKTCPQDCIPGEARPLDSETEEAVVNKEIKPDKQKQRNYLIIGLVAGGFILATGLGTAIWFFWKKRKTPHEELPLEKE